MTEIYSEEWIRSAKRALAWFISYMGEEEWSRRKREVVKYFNDLHKNELTGSFASAASRGQLDEHRPYAIYDDWIAWYMYLVDSLVDRPGCDEPMQSSRVYPVFAAIGRRLELAKGIDGISARVNELVDNRRNQADSTLFELLVAICYRRNGWEVSFIPESPPEKRPDFHARRGDQQYYIECKRLAKATEYSEREREAWLARWRPLCSYLQKNCPSAFVDVTFKVPVDQVHELSVVALVDRLVKDGHFGSDSYLETDSLLVSASPIDMERVGAHFSKFHVRHPSPQFLALLAGGYESSGSYTTAFVPTEVSAYGPDDHEHTLNIFIGGISSAYCAKWECVAEESIEKKAKDVRTHLSRATSQMIDDEPGIIHIGYETLHGPAVEFRRHEKIMQTIAAFDFGAKQVEMVFCHALQPESGIDTFDFAETTAYYSNGPDPSTILQENLLMDAPGTRVEDSTHWRQDAERIVRGVS